MSMIKRRNGKRERERRVSLIAIVGQVTMYVGKVFVCYTS